MKIHVCALSALLLCSSAMATNQSPNHDPPSTEINANGGKAYAEGGDALAVGIGIGVGGQGGEGGNAVAIGGAGGKGGTAESAAEADASSASTASSSQSQSAAGGNANNTGNAQAVSINHVRNAPGIAQGSLMPSGCGAAANAGGSNTGGAAFLGFAFTTNECYSFLLAQHLTAIGMTDSACDVLMSTKAATKAYRRANLPKPKCDTPDPVKPVVQPTVVVLEADKGVSRQEVDEKVKRAFEASQAK